MIKSQQGEGNGRTFLQLIAKYPELKGSWLDNADNDEPITGIVALREDDGMHGCPGLHFEELESYLNLELDEDLYDGDEDPDFVWIEYYKTEEAHELFNKAYKFFTEQI